jgi:hypothetical protein
VVAALCAGLLASLGTGCRRFEERREKREAAYDPYYLELFQADGRPRARRADDAAGAPAHAKRELHATARFVWIRRKPDEGSDWLGYVTLGETLTLRGDEEVPGGGTVCRTWVPVEPEGWVCLGRDATLDASDPTVAALSPYRARTDQPYPYEYARSMEAPRYRSLPTAADQARRESSHLTRLKRARAAKSAAEVVAIDRNLDGVFLGTTGAPAPPAFTAPYTVLESDEDVPYGSTIAYAYAFDLDDRAFVLSYDHAIIPMSRVRSYPRSHFHGATLDEELPWPIAFAKKTGAHRWTVGARGELERVGPSVEPRTIVALTGEAVEHGGVRYLEQRGGALVLASELIVPKRAKQPPPGLPRGGRGSWVEVSTIEGWLVAYERDRPVFATLISAGRGDLKPDKTMNEHSSTPPGTYAISNKLKTATMRSESRPDSVHAEVMYTQVFHGGFALHGAYWHDDFGERKSAGCVNLSPEDAKWLFDWSEPRVPDEWHAKRTVGADPATLVVIHP